MKILIEWHLWLLPLFAIFEYFLIQQKNLYAAEHGKINEQIDYSISNDYRVSYLFAVLLFLPLIVVSTNRSLSEGDTWAYYTMFNEWPSVLNEVQITNSDKYPGFKIFSVFFKQFISTDYRVWFFVIAAISMLCIATTYQKYTSEVVLCAYFFYTADFQSWANNGCRQFMVVSIMFALTPLLFGKKLSKILVFILVGWILFYFHVSVLIVLPLYFIALGKPMNKWTILFILMIVVTIVFINQFSGLISDTLENTSYEKSSSEISSINNGTNLFRVAFFSVPAILAIVFRGKLDDNIPQMIAYSINMSIIGAAFYVLSAFMNGVTIGRMPIYFTLYNYILIPWEIRHFFEKKEQRIVFSVFIIAFFIFYVFQMIKWGR